MNRSLLILMMLLTMLSCNTITLPTFEGLENVELEEVNSRKLVVMADMVINNPNSFALDLAEADLYAIVEEIELARINQTFNTEMPAKTDFKMPVRIDLDLSKLYKDDPLGAISKGLKIINEKQINVLFQGEIKVGKGKAMVSVPIDQLENVKF